MANEKIAVIYYSATGTTYKLAQAVEEGAKAAGAEVRFRRVKELAPEEAIKSNEGWSAHRLETQAVEEASNGDLEWADAIIMGTPTRYGLPAAQLKQFIDGTGGLWAKGALNDKVFSAFTSVATLHGGHESTILSIYNIAYSWGCLIVAPSYADPIQFQAGNPYGASFVSNNGALSPDETALAAARFQGTRVTKITRQLLAGRKTAESEQ
jgi:NAD(P)H dehydrogenase (quinone)